ncbi:MAG: DUF3696 domain-containing protein [Syntrophus sp. (in: bacteria)]
MITKWYLNCFKSFASNTELDIRPITVLTGPNSSGKSSVIQSMLLLSQSLTEYSTKNNLLLNGNLVTCGTTGDVVSKNQPKKSFEIGCHISHCTMEKFNTVRRQRSNVRAISGRVNGFFPFPEAENLIYESNDSIEDEYPQPELGQPMDAIPFQSHIRFGFTTQDDLGYETRKLEFMPLMESFVLRSVTSQLGEGRLYEWDVKSDTEIYRKNLEWLQREDCVPQEAVTIPPEGLRYVVRCGGLSIDYFLDKFPGEFTAHAKILGVTFSGLLPNSYYISFDERERKIDLLFEVLGIPGGSAFWAFNNDTPPGTVLSDFAKYHDYIRRYETGEDMSWHPFAEKWEGRRPFLKLEGNEEEGDDEEDRIYKARKASKKKEDRIYKVRETFYNDVMHPEFPIDTSGKFKTIWIEMLGLVAEKAADERARNIIYSGIDRIKQDGSIKNIWGVMSDLYGTDIECGKSDSLPLSPYPSDPNPDGWIFFTPEINKQMGQYAKRLREALMEGEIPQPVLRQVRINPDSLWRKIGTNVTDFFRYRFQYVGPLREDPRPLYPHGKSGNQKDVGSKGEQVAHVLYLFGNEIIEYFNPVEMGKELKNPCIQKASLKDAVNSWMAYMGVADNVDPGDPSKLGYALKVQPAAQEFYLDLTQVGVGASQVLPILTAGLIAEPGTTLVFEQPELHLHPRVQSRLADFFVSLLLCGKQVIVETHSEYIINRLRYRSVVADGDLVASQVGILFFENETGTTTVRNVQMNEYGYIGEWPKGFFDEGDELSAAILQAALLKRKLAGAQKNG